MTVREKETVIESILRMPITFTLVIVIVLSYYLVFGQHCYFRCPLDWKADPIVRLFLHPLIHESDLHLWGNVFGLVILGALVERWMTPTNRKRQLTIFGLSYVLSFLMVLLGWIVFGVGPGIGASGIVSALVGFLVIYYWYYPNLMQLQGTARHAPFLIGLVLSPLVLSLFAFLPSSNTGYQFSETMSLYTFAAHWTCFFMAYVAARFLYRKWQFPKPQSLS